MRLVSERPSVREMAQYRDSERMGALHRAAAKLWVKGVPMKDAIKIVSDAVSESHREQNSFHATWVL